MSPCDRTPAARFSWAVYRGDRGSLAGYQLGEHVAAAPTPAAAAAALQGMLGLIGQANTPVASALPGGAEPRGADTKRDPRSLL